MARVLRSVAVVAVAGWALGGWAPGAWGQVAVPVCPPPCLPSSAPPGGPTITMDTTDLLPAASHSEDGVLRRTEDGSPAPLMATYVGVSVVAATLAVLTRRRRGIRRQEREMQSGVAQGRRPEDFWTGAVPRIRRPEPI